MSTVTLTIEGLAKGGEAVAHHEGRVVFVDRCAPGDVVEVELREGGERLLRGHVVKRVSPGEARVVPPCPIAEVCGGCRWMHVAAATQAEAKERIFYEALERIGRVPRSALDAQPIREAPQTLGYRRRARLHVRRGKLGYLRERSHELVELPGCPVLEPVLDAAVRALPTALEAHGLLARTSELDLVTDGTRWSLALHVDKVTGALRDRAEQLVRAVGARGAVLVAEGAAPVLVGKPALGTLRPDVFAQVNGESNALLVEAAVAQLAPRPGMRVLELFAGSGNFTLPIAAAGADVVAVEFAGPALGLLRNEANARGLKSIRIVEGDALDRAKALASEGQRFDALVLDPPRAGCSGLAPVARQLGVARIVYVSCDPATLARDVGELASAGFVPAFARPFDLFPQTPHVEGLVVLRRGV